MSGIVCSLDHLGAAARHTLRGKSRQADAAWFLFRREEVLMRLHRTLADGTWRPRRFRIRLIHDPKPRAIACPSIEDRVVHAALTLLAEPVFLRTAVADTYACRQGGGTHRALLALQRHMRHHRFALHLDIRAFFPSIDLDRLRLLLARRIRDEAFLGVFDRVLQVGAEVYQDIRVCRHARLPWPHPTDRGLPIGALTSQLCAGFVYLDAFDHFVKRVLKVPGYVRYMDDFFFFGDRRADLRGWRQEAAAWLQAERGLLLKHPDAPLLACAGHLDGLGYRIRRESFEVLPKALRRLRHRLRTAWVEEREALTLQNNLDSTVAWALFG